MHLKISITKLNLKCGFSIIYCIVQLGTKTGTFYGKLNFSLSSGNQQRNWSLGNGFHGLH